MTEAELQNILLQKNKTERQKSCLSLSRADMEIISSCGDFNFKNNNYEKAIDYYLRYLGVDNKNAQIYYKIALCFAARKKFSDAITYLEKASFLDEENPEYLSELAKLYYKKNDIEKALNVFEKLICVSPENYWGFSNLGNICFYHLNDYEKAYEYYEKALVLNPCYDWGLYNFANTKVLFQKTDEAILLYERACELSPDNDIFQMGLAHTYYKNGNVDRSINLFKKLLEKDKDNFEILLCLGKIYLYDKKDYFSAKKYFELAQMLEQNNPEIYYCFAKIAFFDFDKKNAIINITKALELDSDNDRAKALKNMIEEMD